MNEHRAGVGLIVATALAVLFLAGRPVQAAPLNQPAAPPANLVVITEKAGAAVADYPVQIGRPFLRGEIANFPQAVIDGSAIPTQADVKQRYPDGSVKHAILSFLVPRLPANGAVKVAFRNQATADNTPLSKEQMLDPKFDFDAVMELGQADQTRTVSARKMLQDGRYTCWTAGPVATTIILADHSVERCYDLGFDDHRSFRPIFHATFWPGVNKVRVRFIGEVANSEALQDVVVTALALKMGQRRPREVYRLATPLLTMCAMSRWTKEYWIGGQPSTVAIDHNLPYLIATRFLPNYDTSKVIPEETVAGAYAAWQKAPKDLYDAGQWTKGMGATGGRPEIGPYPAWTVRWFYSWDPRAKEQAFGAADLAAAWGGHIREGRSGKKFLRTDPDGANTGLGKPVSIAGRPTVFLGWYMTQTHGNAPADKITVVGPLSNGGWGMDTAHQPDAFSPQYMLSGDFWYLEEMQMWAAVTAGMCHPGGGNYPHARGPNGSYGGIRNGGARADAWTLRNRIHTAFLTPDNSPEKQYFATLITDALALWEGLRDITGTPLQGHECWTWANTVALPQYKIGVSPLHSWESPNSGLIENLDATKTSGGGSPWMENFQIFALGRARELDYPADALLAWSATNVIGQLTDPAYEPRLIAAYRLPLAGPDGGWLKTWAETKAAFSAETLERLTKGDGLKAWGPHINTEHGYPVIAMCAASAIADQPGGQAAWKWISRQLLANPAFNRNPKWCILPRLSIPKTQSGQDERGRDPHLPSVSRLAQTGPSP